MFDIIKWISVTGRYGKIYLDKYLRELGTNSSQHMFIKKICECEGITQEKLQPVLHINKSNVARAVAQLSQNGFIRQEPSARDKRKVRLYPTDKARAVYARIVEIETEWINVITADFNDGEKRRFSGMLETAARRAMDAVREDGREGDEPDEK